MNDTFERIKSLMVSEFQLDPVRIMPATELTDLGVDSLAALEFVFELEDKFQITLESETDLRGGLVQDVVDAVNLALSRQPSVAVAM